MTIESSPLDIGYKSDEEEIDVRRSGKDRDTYYMDGTLVPSSPTYFSDDEKYPVPQVSPFEHKMFVSPPTTSALEYNNTQHHSSSITSANDHDELIIATYKRIHHQNATSGSSGKDNSYPKLVISKKSVDENP
jgi:hypothetical protein